MKKKIAPKRQEPPTGNAITNIQFSEYQRQLIIAEVRKANLIMVRKDYESMPDIVKSWCEAIKIMELAL